MNRATPRAVWFLAPWAVGAIGLTFLPMLASLCLSFTRTDVTASSLELSWVGTQHYRQAFAVDRAHGVSNDDPWYWRLLGGKPNDHRFYQSLYNSLFYSIFAVPLGLCTSLAIAVLLNRRLRGGSIIRAIVYLPHLLGGVATIVIWSWLFNPQFGCINQLIRAGYDLLDPLVRLIHENGTHDWPVPGWLYSPAWCKPAVILISTWTMGGSMLIFLAALRSVSPVLYEAAKLDGAGAWHQFRFITLPQITPAILFNLTISLIFAMQSFNEGYLLQNRRQHDGLLFYVLYLYRTAFESPYRLGYASALAWILFLVLFVLTMPLLISSRHWVQYANEP